MLVTNVNLLPLPQLYETVWEIFKIILSVQMVPKLQFFLFSGIDYLSKLFNFWILN